DGRLNLAELLDAFPKTEPPPKPTPPPRLLLQHARVSAGVLSFTDLSRREPHTASMHPIDIELHDITTLPGRRGPYAIAATLIGGGVLEWDGQISLTPVASTGHLALRGFPLATAWRFIRDDVALAEPSGRLDVAVGYQFAYRDEATSMTVDGVEATVTGLVLTARGEQTPLLTLDKIRLAGARGDLISRELTVPEISVSRGRVGATVARKGTLDWQMLTA